MSTSQEAKKKKEKHKNGENKPWQGEEEEGIRARVRGRETHVRRENRYNPQKVLWGRGSRNYHPRQEGRQYSEEK